MANQERCSSINTVLIWGQIDIELRKLFDAEFLLLDSFTLLFSNIIEVRAYLAEDGIVETDKIDLTGIWPGTDALTSGSHTLFSSSR